MMYTSRNQFYKVNGDNALNHCGHVHVVKYTIESMMVLINHR